MKNTIKNLINQVKKAIDNKASIPALSKAYINNNGDVIARNLSDADIIYKANKEVLTPIAKKTGAMYMDTLLIIAAIMAIYSDIEA